MAKRPLTCHFYPRLAPRLSRGFFYDGHAASALVCVWTLGRGPPQQLRQPRDIGGDPPRLVSSENFGLSGLCLRAGIAATPRLGHWPAARHNRPVSCRPAQGQGNGGWVRSFRLPSVIGGLGLLKETKRRQGRPRSPAASISIHNAIEALPIGRMPRPSSSIRLLRYFVRPRSRMLPSVICGPGWGFRTLSPVASLARFASAASRAQGFINHARPSWRSTEMK